MTEEEIAKTAQSCFQGCPTIVLGSGASMPHGLPSMGELSTYWVSAVSSAIEITATRAGFTYIPATRILAIKGADLGIPLGRTKLIPDQLFAVKYPVGYRAFALEVDRGTEPVQSKAARKSLSRSVRQYREALNHKLHQRHYGHKSNLIVLWVFSNKRRQQQFESILIPDDKVIRNTVVSGSTPRFHRTSSSITSALALPKPSTV